MSTARRLVSFDWAIKRILRNKASFSILEGFLSELLRDDIAIAQVLESESNRDRKNARSNRVDLLVENSSKDLIIVEIQHDTEYDYLQRMLFGVSKVLVEHIEKSESYARIRKVVSINIVYFDLGQGDDYIYLGQTHFTGMNKKDVLKLNSTQQELYKAEKIADIYPEYYIIKINRFDDVARNTIDEWIYFLKNEKIEDSFTAKGLKEAKEQLDILKLSDEERRDYDLYLESLHYEASMYESSYVVGKMKGEKQGVEIGEKLGELKARRDMARSLKENGVAINLIVKTSGLTPEEIDAL